MTFVVTGPIKNTHNDVCSALGYLCLANVGIAADVSEAHATFNFRVNLGKVEFLSVYIHICL
jgi:hypothetical protein